jgi:hypothetical protein
MMPKKAKAKKANEINLFTFLNQIQNKSRKFPYDKKIANAYMLTQWISHDKNLIHIANEINKYQFTLPDHMVYEYFMSAVPQGRRYLKWAKKKKDQEMEDDVKKLQELYPDISSNEARMAVSFMRNKNVKGE